MPETNKYAEFNIICGAPGTGKSTRTEKWIDLTHFKNVLVYMEHVDLEGDAFKKLPVVPFFGTYKGGKAKIDADEVGIVEFLTALSRKFRNGKVAVDEAGLYKRLMEDKKGEPITPLLDLFKKRRKYNVELDFIYHSVSEVPVQFFKFCNNVILFHQTDMFQHKSAVIPRIKELNEAKERIQQRYFEGNKYYCERIRLQ